MYWKVDHVSYGFKTVEANPRRINLALFTCVPQCTAAIHIHLVRNPILCKPSIPPWKVDKNMLLTHKPSLKRILSQKRGIF